ncbi:MAG: hypothetical protein HN929_14305 [Chloroflexi bacterium]|nr:hypothetical protein [Chloroflexota bacterium]
MTTFHELSAHKIAGLTRMLPSKLAHLTDEAWLDGTPPPDDSRIPAFIELVKDWPDREKTNTLVISGSPYSATELFALLTKYDIPCDTVRTEPNTKQLLVDGFEEAYFGDYLLASHGSLIEQQEV